MLSNSLGADWARYTGGHVSTTFYFLKGDARLSSHLVIPDSSELGARNHWEVRECGKPTDSIPPEQLLKLDEQWRDRFKRGEKGLDMSLACDALMLAATERATELIFLVNDSDYVPLFDALRRLGGNVYLAGLQKGLQTTKELCDLSDRYQTLDHVLDELFEKTCKWPSPLAKRYANAQNSVSSGKS